MKNICFYSCVLTILSSFQIDYAKAFRIHLGTLGQYESTEDVLKRKSIVSNVDVVFDQNYVKSCQKLTIVQTSRPVEIWQKHEACNIKIQALKKDVAFLKGNTLLLNFAESNCDRKEMVGTAYICQKDTQ